jgi:HlyD family type I secretion membrane fusion protein
MKVRKKAEPSTIPAAEKPAKPSNSSQSPFPPAAMAIGLAACGLFVSGFVVWSALAPLSSAVLANGVVSVESYRKSVQHLEGGIVAEIKANDGDKVEAGAVLIEIRDVATRANVDQLSTEHFQLTAAAARLAAEQDNAGSIAFPETLTGSSDPRARAAIDAETKVFSSAQTAKREAFAVIDGKIRQLSEEIKGFQGQIASNAKQAGLVGEQLTDIRKLLEQKLTRKSQALELEARQAGLEGEISRLEARIAEARQEILELEQQKQARDAERVAKAAAELNTVQAKAFMISRELAAASDVQHRRRVVAPIAGIVVNSKVHSVGGVVTPGQILMEIVPAGDALVIEARVRPEDVEVVHAGLPADIVPTTLNRRYTRPLAGTLESVSADRLVDPRTGEAYYLARVRVEGPTPAGDGERVLLAGMAAEVFIKIGDRTFLEYVAAPLVKSFTRSMRES